MRREVINFLFTKSSLLAVRISVITLALHLQSILDEKAYCSLYQVM